MRALQSLHPAASSALVLILSPFLLAGECPGGGPEVTGRAVSVDRVDAISARIDITYGGHTFRWESGQASDGIDCVAELADEEVCEPAGADKVVRLVGRIRFECQLSATGAPIAEFDNQIYVGDPRALDPGTSEGKADGFLWVRRPCPGSESCPYDTCYHEVNAGQPYELTVTSATGSARPWPDLVTADFERSWTFGWSASATGSGDPQDGDHCDADMTLTAQVSVALTAARFHGDTIGTCHDAI